jgi:hypothetical protein
LPRMRPLTLNAYDAIAALPTAALVSPGSLCKGQGQLQRHSAELSGHSHCCAGRHATCFAVPFATIHMWAPPTPCAHAPAQCHDLNYQQGFTRNIVQWLNGCAAHTCGLLPSDHAVTSSREGMYSPAGAASPPTAMPKFCSSNSSSRHSVLHNKTRVLPHRMRQGATALLWGTLSLHKMPACLHFILVYSDRSSQRQHTACHAATSALGCCSHRR